MEKSNNTKEKERYSPLEIVGIAGGPIVFYHYLGKPTRDVCEGVAEAVDGLKTVSHFINRNKGSDVSVKYIERIDPQVKASYESSKKGILSTIKDNSKEALEAMQRGAYKAPGTSFWSVRKLVETKAKILEKTSGAFKDKKEKEELTMRTSQSYATNYNDVGRLRLSAVKKVNEIDSQIGEYSQRIALNESRSGQVSQSDLNVLEGMVRERNNVSDLTGKMNSLSVTEINQGINNPEYKTILKQAEDYGIRAYDPSHWGDGGVFTGLVLSAVLGYKLVKPVKKFVNTLEYHGKRAYSLSSKILNKLKTK